MICKAEAGKPRVCKAVTGKPEYTRLRLEYLGFARL